MNNTLRNKFLFWLCLILIPIIIFIYNNKIEKNAICYVNKEFIFKEFNMTKQSIKATNKEYNFRKKEVDSLYFLFRNTSSKNDKAYQFFLKKKNDLEEFRNNTKLVETNKIWERINSYTKQYGEEKDYTLILCSAKNQNDVLFVDEKIDITNDLLNYINSRYEGQ